MRQSVLVVDDCDAIREVVEHWLRPEQVDVHHAATAANGMDAARRLAPDLILLDLLLPDEHGLVVCRWLKEDPATAEIPVVFLTGEDGPASLVEGFDVGGVDYITKPFVPAELRARVRGALRTKRLHDLLARRARLDGLTGLYDRGAFEERLSAEMTAVARYRRDVSLILIDLDGFKGLNDRHGHPFGDRVLREVASALEETVRETDMACRYGGDELALILTETDLDGAVSLAERARRRIEALSFEHEGGSVSLTASLGAASAEHLAEPTVEALVEAADRALYEAKAAGRNRVRGAVPLTSARPARAPRAGVEPARRRGAPAQATKIVSR